MRYEEELPSQLKFYDAAWHGRIITLFTALWQDVFSVEF
jgi:hypothetical protein